MCKCFSRDRRWGAETETEQEWKAVVGFVEWFWHDQRNLLCKHQTAAGFLLESESLWAGVGAASENLWNQQTATGWKHLTGTSAQLAGLFPHTWSQADVTATMKSNTSHPNPLLSQPIVVPQGLRSLRSVHMRIPMPAPYLLVKVGLKKGGKKGRSRKTVE